MKLKFPAKFQIQYPFENNKYYNQPFKDVIAKIFLESCNNYCMYCGKSLLTDGKLVYNIEHSIEKANNSKKNESLDHCKYNMSIACPDCNQTYKRRMIEPIKFEVNCKAESCDSLCDQYLIACTEYQSKNSIVLQPRGITNTESGNNFEIEYNLLKHIFQPVGECSKIDGSVGKYNEREYNFISEHISRFHLNREMFTNIVLNICEDIYDKIQLFGELHSVEKILKAVTKKRYENVLGEIFFGYIHDNFHSTKDLNEFCKLLITLDYI